MIVLVSLIVLLRGFPCFHDFSHGASLHPYSFDLYTCSTYFSWFAYKRSYNIRSYAYKRSYNIRAYARISLVKWRRSSSHTLDS